MITKRVLGSTGSWRLVAPRNTNSLPLAGGIGRLSVVRWRALVDACVRCWRGAVRGGSGRWPDRLSRLRRAAGALGVRTRAGADAARRSPAAAPADGPLSMREDARAASGVVCAAPARRDRGDHRRVAGRRRRPRASHDRRAAGHSPGHGALLTAARPSPRRPRSTSRPPRCCTSSSRRSSGSIPGWRRPARGSAPRPRKSAAWWTTLPAQGLSFPVKTAESTAVCAASARALVLVRTSSEVAAAPCSHNSWRSGSGPSGPSEHQALCDPHKPRPMSVATPATREPRPRSVLPSVNSRATSRPSCCGWKPKWQGVACGEWWRGLQMCTGAGIVYYLRSGWSGKPVDSPQPTPCARRPVSRSLGEPDVRLERLTGPRVSQVTGPLEAVLALAGRTRCVRAVRWSLPAGED